MREKKKKKKKQTKRKRRLISRIQTLSKYALHGKDASTHLSCIDKRLGFVSQKKRKKRKKERLGFIRDEFTEG